MNQPSLNPPRRPGRWMRLALLIAGVGVLSLIGAALGHGLGVFISGGAEAQAIGAPTQVALARPTTAAAPDAAPPANAQLPATSAPASPTQVHSSPIPSSPTPALPASARPAQQRAAGLGQPTHLPRTGGDDAESMIVLALALFVIGVVLWAAPRAGFGRREE